MRTENIYDAISGFDEEYVSAADNTDAIRLSFQKNRTRKIKMIGTVCACAIAVIVSGWIGSQGWFGKKPPAAPNGFVTRESTSVFDNPVTGQTQDRQTTVGEQSTTEPAKETESRISKKEDHTQAVPTVNQNQQETKSNVSQTKHPVSTKTVEKPTNSSKEVRRNAPQTSRPVSTRIVEKTTGSSVVPTSVEATTVVGDPKMIIYKDVRVDYNTAKSYFGHPIVRCERNDFTGYSVLLYNANGKFNEPGTKCLSLTYLFTNGSVVLYDQGRTGKNMPTGNRQNYRGKTFYVHTPEFNGDNIRIGYYPTGTNGIAYQAHFNSGSDVNEIMDLILSLEM